MAPSSRKTSILTARIAPEVKLALRAAADAERRSLANMLEVAVLEYCKSHHAGLIQSGKKETRK
jgi:uncharacterized protein (DUF1778 family)